MKETSDKALTIKSLVVPVVLLLIMWTVYVLMRYFGQSHWVQHGLHAGSGEHPEGFLLWPFIHSPTDITHVVNNSIPTLVLGWALFYFYPKVSWRVLGLIWIMSGICVWISARESIHIGMSGVIYGLFGFLLTGGVISKNRNLMGVSLMVIFLYGSMIWGIFPMEERISWEGHLWGLISGVAFAFVYRQKGPNSVIYAWEDDNDDEEDDNADDGDKPEFHVPPSGNAWDEYVRGGN